MTYSPTVQLNDGYSMPQIGLGVYQIPENETAEMVTRAIDLGYRAVDTATIYGNEREVGEGVRARDETIFVTTKLWNDAHGRGAARQAFEDSFARLGLDWLDLYLIHWPQPQHDLYVETWRALIELREEGRVRSIGVSNFTVAQLRRLIDETGVVPAVNQIELHPAFPQDELVDFHREHDIATISWSPLGRGAILDDPVIAQVAARHGRSPAQIILRWHLERGLCIIPKTRSPERLAENFALHDFALDSDDMASIATLARADGRIFAESM
ncbi:aldo/keto reductase [Sphingomonas jatrophae]|uniref:2,5-diketo-D-gluconate reductase A n=1 Tax=Sphingomonas jatrophae TaxID=1166337 RepID=A0A1I6K7L0_9SPHN|nr:aldo/keto reductase [Sphingomonas jatrophae]SFR87245.1 2,5-diketo-D-gluconate reductase A [Sphingomonas jatrophae]